MKTAAFRGCWNNTMLCDRPYVVNTTDFSLIVHYECCDTNNCNSDPIEVPPVNTTENGLYCKACFVEGSYKCKEYVTIACTGYQGDCFEFYGDACRPGVWCRDVLQKTGEDGNLQRRDVNVKSHHGIRTR
ncbi:protein RoBo-1-like [Anomaloglossus baeobatrachus]